jgi:uncharacterized protein
MGGIVGTAGCLENLENYNQVGGRRGDGFIAIGTGGTGGVYYILGGGIADLLNASEELDVNASAEATGASVENAELLNREEIEMALVLDNTAIQAAEGLSPFDEQVPLQAAFGGYYNHTHVLVTEDSGIETLADLEGMTVSVGDPGSGTDIIAEELLDWYGLSYDDIDERQLAFDETADALIDNQIDAGFWSVGPPVSSVEEVYAQRDVELLDFPEDDLEELEAEFPYYVADVIPGGTYPGEEEDIANPTVVNTIAVHENMDEDLLYTIMEIIFENIETLEEIHHTAGDFEESARDSDIEYHPGAEAFLDDTGL